MKHLILLLPIVISNPQRFGKVSAPIQSLGEHSYVDQCNVNAGTFRHEKKVWFQTRCVNCKVCGSDLIGGPKKQSEDFCNNAQHDICRGGCSCPVDMYRHNITRLENGKIVTVETCITDETCHEIINGAKCPYPQIWENEAPLCIRTCKNKDGADPSECSQLWTQRCICPKDKPILHEGNCVKYEECPF